MYIENKVERKVLDYIEYEEYFGESQYSNRLDWDSCDERKQEIITYGKKSYLIKKRKYINGERIENHFYSTKEYKNYNLTVISEITNIFEDDDKIIISTFRKRVVSPFILTGRVCKERHLSKIVIYKNKPLFYVIDGKRIYKNSLKATIMLYSLSREIKNEKFNDFREKYNLITHETMFIDLIFKIHGLTKDNFTQFVIDFLGGYDNGFKTKSFIKMIENKHKPFMYIVKGLGLNNYFHNLILNSSEKIRLIYNLKSLTDFIGPENVIKYHNILNYNISYIFPIQDGYKNEFKDIFLKNMKKINSLLSDSFFDMSLLVDDFTYWKKLTNEGIIFDKFLNFKDRNEFIEVHALRYNKFKEISTKTYNRIYPIEFKEYITKPINDFNIIILESNIDYISESISQSHCVSSYVNKFNSIIISLSNGKKRYTFEISQFKVIQARTYKNYLLNPEHEYLRDEINKRLEKIKDKEINYQIFEYQGNKLLSETTFSYK